MKDKYRTVFISDLHLGSTQAKAEEVYNFLKTVDCTNLYLIGDIIDFWALSRKIYFPKSHLNVIQRLLKMAKSGTKVIWITGNHDEPLRKFTPVILDNIEIVDETVHITADNKSYLVIHGDKFDQVVKYAKWLAYIGAIGYEFLIKLNMLVNYFRRYFNFGYWSLSKYIKNSVKQATNFIGGYEEAVATEVKNRGLHGVICGHIHHAVIKDLHGIHYCNDGDFVESCSAIVEHEDGRLELIEI